VEGQRDFQLDEATIADLGSMVEEGVVSARSLAEAYLERIEQLDGSLASVVEVNPEALDIADTMDRERREGLVRGPLHGIPVMVKDNIATADRMRTTAGSLAMRDARPSRDAAVVHRLREAGAVLLAKTNLSEWANFRSERSSSGWSAVGGQCHNPSRARPQPVRVEFGLGRRGGGEPVRRGDRD
jgi:amidase